MNDYIRLKKRDIFKLGIKDEEGNPVLDKDGKEVCIMFDLEDINTPDNYSKSVYLAKKATSTLRNELVIINKKQDSEGKGAMTKNEEAKMQALKRYYKNLEEAIDLFLGKDGTQKVFGDSRYLTMYDDLSEMLEPIMPKLKLNLNSIDEKIKAKYSNNDGNVLKDE